MRNVAGLTDYEKAVASVAGQIYAVELSDRLQNLKEGESFSVDQLITECTVDAFALVDGIFEITRDHGQA